MLINLLLVLCLNANHALDESGQVCRRPADGLKNDICHAPSVFGLLCATACGKRVLFFRSVCSQLICKLSADQGRIALFYNGVHSMDCVRLSLLNTLTQSSLLHETPPSIAWHIDVHFESMASPLWVGSLVFSLWRRAAWRLSLHMLHSMFSSQSLAVCPFDRQQ